MQNTILTKSSGITVFFFLLVGTLLAGCGGKLMSAELSSPDYSNPVITGNIESADIKESSGLSASECQDVLWTHNDAGNDAFIFAMSLEGKHLGTWRVQNARNVDWESITSYKDAGGKCFLIIGDIGDNDEARTELEIYRVPEPTPSAETAKATSANSLQTEPAQSMKFIYPNGRHNAETIMVHPGTGDIYVVTKKKSGPAGVYRIKPAFGSAETIKSEKVAEVSVPSKPEGLLTGGSMSPDGKRVMLCDLKSGYELVLPDGMADVDAIWKQKVLVVDLGDRKQGEGVSYGRDGVSLYASSEKKNSPLFLIRRK